MLAQANRLKKELDITKVLKKGRSFKEGFLILKSVKNERGQTRFGFIVSKKVSNKANIRNRIRRQLREVIRLRVKQTNQASDNLVIALKGIEKEKPLIIRESLNNIITRAKLFND